MRCRRRKRKRGIRTRKSDVEDGDGKMYRNYIFDFYGTLADIRTDEENPSLWRKMSEIYSAMGAAYGPEELKSAFRRLEREECGRLGTRDAEPDLTKVFALLYREKRVSCEHEQATQECRAAIALRKNKGLQDWPRVCKALFFLAAMAAQHSFVASP